MILTTQQAAERLHLTRRRILAFIEEGRLPAQKYGRDWLIDEADLANLERKPQGWAKGRPRRKDDTDGTS